MHPFADCNMFNKHSLRQKLEYSLNAGALQRVLTMHREKQGTPARSLYRNKTLFDYEALENDS